MLKCHSEEKAHNLITKWNIPQGLQEKEGEEETKEEKCKSESRNTKGALRLYRTAVNTE